MRSVRSLFPRLLDPDFLEEAARLTVRGKRRRPDVADFLFRRESTLRELRHRLHRKAWRHGSFRALFVRDPKPRLVAVAGILDRVLHTALVRLMEPAWSPTLSEDDFACRPGFGTHRARLRLLQLVRRHRWFLHLDVRAYFPSIDLGILRGLLAERIRDRAFLEVVDGVLEAGARVYTHPGQRAFARLEPDWPPLGSGLPIGAHTSQFLAAHVYLLAFDAVVKREWRVPGYLRYVDDLFLFGDDRRELEQIRERVADWLRGERKLELKAPRARVRSCHGHLDALGGRIGRRGVEVRARRLRELGAVLARECRRERHGGSKVDLRASVEARMGELFPD